ncbi:CPBP family intramembrane glutamic endopeptidase [Occallatibacter riparius]|uniref:CPBP family intramembrane metalloprotease n=1 Tax=Occallatibacter riparius TaxID=1002689 RepID=A0A9J7BMJ6_9BACT|nr:CPBP family intramembrane glutamic endopeptidase [Occallatibacter riparius]UWZ82134.1 CPBP family intramembrane metalloprotease [Occallatibacter riparius]
MTGEKNARRLRTAFFGERGIRPGWLFAIFVALNYLLGPILDYVLPKIHFPAWDMTWLGMTSNEWLNFAAVALLTRVMCRIDRTPFSSHGLSTSPGSTRLFAQGVVWGIVPSIIIVIPIWLAGACSFHGLALAPAELIKYAALWALAFLGVGFAEEFTFRGYAQQTLSRAIGFWPAAAILSSVFGLMHLIFKPNEGWIDPLSVALYGMFWCLTLRRTGTLWFAIGFHAASDYTDMVVFAEPNTGNAGKPLPGHLLNVEFHGPAWLTGGPRGTEASMLVFAILALLFYFFHKAYPAKRAVEEGVLISN